MHKGRLEAFSDGVLAIIITIMVLEFKVPHGSDWSVLVSLWPVFVSYLISFLYVAIYWNNHHHLFQAVKSVNGRILWANMFLLFTLSLLPFVSGWMGENHFESLPVAFYCIVLALAAMAWWILHGELMKLHPQDSALAKATSNKTKRNFSILIYVVAAAIAFFAPWISCLMSVAVALMWLIPDRRIEEELEVQS